MLTGLLRDVVQQLRHLEGKDVGIRSQQPSSMLLITSVSRANYNATACDMRTSFCGERMLLLDLALSACKHAQMTATQQQLAPRLT